ncbi:MAG: hypothetical protein OXH93_17695 [Caldilineaceae bacterium]|nr:hypothetical protein [Caldilineaceae bacterium]
MYDVVSDIWDSAAGPAGALAGGAHAALTASTRSIIRQISNLDFRNAFILTVLLDSFDFAPARGTQSELCTANECSVNAKIFSLPHPLIEFDIRSR